MPAMRNLQADLPSWAKRLFEPHRYKSVYGGRSGAKSWTVARALLLEATKNRLRILCLREFQTSIRDSVHRLLWDQAYKMGLEFDVSQHEISNKKGSLFLFDGIKNNASKIRSIEGIDRVWLEEAQTISELSYEILVPTIRKAGSEIWLTWNLDQETDPTYRRFFKNPPPDCLQIEVGWWNNPWISEETLKEKDYLYRIDPDAAEHVWGGKTRAINNAQVLFGKISISPFEPAEDWDGPYQGADWGFANDPTVLVRCWIHERKEEALTVRDLYVEHEAYGVGVEVVDTPSLFDKVPEARKFVTRADKSRPETISHLKNNGYGRMVGAEQGPGSVEDGVMHLRSYDKIVIHPRCKNAIQESRLWSHKKDRLTGDVLPDLIKKHDHCWDATRYALEPIMKRRLISYDYQSARKRTSNLGSKPKRDGGRFGTKRGGIL